MIHFWEYWLGFVCFIFGRLSYPPLFHRTSVHQTVSKIPPVLHWVPGGIPITYPGKIPIDQLLLLLYQYNSVTSLFSNGIPQDRRNVFLMELQHEKYIHSLFYQLVDLFRNSTCSPFPSYLLIDTIWNGKVLLQPSLCALPELHLAKFFGTVMEWFSSSMFIYTGCCMHYDRAKTVDAQWFHFDKKLLHI